MDAICAKEEGLSAETKGKIEAAAELSPVEEESTVDRQAEDDYVAEVKKFHAWRNENPDAKLNFDEWKNRNNDGIFEYNGTYVMDTRTQCYLSHDSVARRRKELNADNVRYRLDVRPDGTPQISWLALNYEGCLTPLPHNTETETRMVPAEEVLDLIYNGFRVLTHKEYCKNQMPPMNCKKDEFTAFRLYVQTTPGGRYVGVCPTQGDPGIGNWKHNSDLFHKLHSHAVELTVTVEVPEDMANAIQRNDWAEVARLAKQREV